MVNCYWHTMTTRYEICTAGSCQQKRDLLRLRTDNSITNLFRVDRNSINYVAVY